MAALIANKANTSLVLASALALATGSSGLRSSKTTVLSHCLKVTSASTAPSNCSAWWHGGFFLSCADTPIRRYRVWGDIGAAPIRRYPGLGGYRCGADTPISGSAGCGADTPISGLGGYRRGADTPISGSGGISVRRRYANIRVCGDIGAAPIRRYPGLGDIGATPISLSGGISARRRYADILVWGEFGAAPIRRYPGLRDIGAAPIRRYPGLGGYLVAGFSLLKL